MNNKISISTTLLALTFLLSTQAVFSTELEPYDGISSPDFSLPDLNRDSQSLADYRGKVVLVNFWATWCMPCIEEMPELTQLKHYMDKRPLSKHSFEVLAINVGERENRVKHFTKRMKFKLPVLLDVSSKVFKAWNSKIMPTSFLVDGNGNVRYRVLGNPGWDDEQTLAIIDKLIKEIEEPGDT